MDRHDTEKRRKGRVRFERTFSGSSSPAHRNVPLNVMILGLFHS